MGKGDLGGLGSFKAVAHTWSPLFAQAFMDDGEKKASAPAVVAEHDWPEGRRLQIDVTWFRLDDGVAWVYRVEDVKTRQCVAASAAPTLSQERAAAPLLEGHQRYNSPWTDQTALDPE